jgi:hypothetical protein
MRIEFQAEGGFAHFPGLSRPLILDTSEPGLEDAARLEHLVHAARFFELPLESELAPASRASADRRSYTITVKQGETSHTIRRVEPIADPQLKSLVDYLRVMQRRMAGSGAP